MSRLDQLRTIRALGIPNVLAVIRYRALKRAGYYARTLPIGPVAEGPFFDDSPHAGEAGIPEPVRSDVASTLHSLSKGPARALASSCLPASFRFFSRHDIALEDPPDWLMNRWNGATARALDKHWSRIEDFDGRLGDIKTIWELSRMDWLPVFAWEYRNGMAGRKPLIERWLRDWAAKNPPNQGVNWKCGQETSLRAINLLAASLALDNRFEAPLPGLIELLLQHGRRVEKTLSYAVAQDNNHGTSEAAALFAIGSFVALHSDRNNRLQAMAWQRAGRQCLEERAARLIADDGSFAQHSVVYHRLMLDTVSFVELFRRRLGMAAFSDCFCVKAVAATTWLHAVVDPETGDAPNLGDNDGAHLFRLGGTSYRDFRPSVELACQLFRGGYAYDAGFEHPLSTLFGLGRKASAKLPGPTSILFRSGGYAILRDRRKMALLRLPVYRFRPGHADALHLDLWHGGRNIVRDSGSYSYNDTIDGSDSMRLFSSTGFHSTAELDRRDQMPALGRFLFGAWLRPTRIDFDASSATTGSGYVDHLGGSHRREVTQHATGWTVRDDVDGFRHLAIVRWRLIPSDWQCVDNQVAGPLASFIFQADQELTIRLAQTLESRHYLEFETIPVIEVLLNRPGTLRTTIVVPGVEGD